MHIEETLLMFCHRSNLPHSRLDAMPRATYLLGTAGVGNWCRPTTRTYWFLMVSQPGCHTCIMFCFPLNLFIFHIYDSSLWAILAGGLHLVGNHGMVSMSYGMTQSSSTRGVLCVFRGSGGAALDKNAVPWKRHSSQNAFATVVRHRKKKKQAHILSSNTPRTPAQPHAASLLVGHTSRELHGTTFESGNVTLYLLRLFRCTLTTAHLIVERTRNCAKALPSPA